jgi:hypothetical protein
MTEEQIERLIRALETVAAKLPSPSLGVPASSAQWHNCACAPGTICGNSACPRRTQGGQTSAVDQHYHFQPET